MNLDISDNDNKRYKNKFSEIQFSNKIQYYNYILKKDKSNYIDNII